MPSVVFSGSKFSSCWSFMESSVIHSTGVQENTFSGMFPSLFLPFPVHFLHILSRTARENETLALLKFHHHQPQVPPSASMASPPTFLWSNLLQSALTLFPAALGRHAFRHDCKFPKASAVMWNYESIKPLFFINYPVSNRIL